MEFQDGPPQKPPAIRLRCFCLFHNQTQTTNSRSWEIQTNPEESPDPTPSGAGRWTIHAQQSSLPSDAGP